MKLMPLTKKVKCRRAPSRFISAEKSVRSCQRVSSVQLSNAMVTNCGGRSTARAGRQSEHAATTTQGTRRLMPASRHDAAKAQAIPGFYVNGAVTAAKRVVRRAGKGARMSGLPDMRIY